MPNSRRKNPRSLHRHEMLSERDALQDDKTTLYKTEQDEIEALKGKTTHFFENICNLKPYWYQQELAELYKQNQFIAIRWPRQTGKSTSIGALLLQDAIENNNLNIGFIGPSWRQTKLNIRRVSAFCRNLPTQGLQIQKTQISLPNNSTIEAFPNNPDTIRGNSFDRIWIDEANFLSNDEELYDAILFTMGTRKNAKLIVSSTPFNTDSLFWKMCNHKNYTDFIKHHFTWEKALEPNGPLNQKIVEKIKNQFGDDPARWRREMEAEWAEDEDVWLPQSLIAQCIGTTKNCGTDLQQHNPEQKLDGEFYGGLDLAQTRDWCVFSVVERKNNQLLLRHLKIFQKPTLYASVIGYIKVLQDRWNGFEKIRVDFTREGPSIIADMENAGINNAEGVNFSVPRKSEMASLLKQRMANKQFFYPLLNWEKPYRGDICNELNIERYDLRKDGNIGFSHPAGTHDDVFWSIALAIYGTVEMTPEPPFLAIIPR